MSGRFEIRGEMSLAEPEVESMHAGFLYFIADNIQGWLGSDRIEGRPPRRAECLKGIDFAEEEERKGLFCMSCVPLPPRMRGGRREKEYVFTLGYGTTGMDWLPRENREQWFNIESCIVFACLDNFFKSM